MLSENASLYIFAKIGLRPLVNMCRYHMLKLNNMACGSLLPICYRPRPTRLASFYAIYQYSNQYRYILSSLVQFHIKRCQLTIKEHLKANKYVYSNH